MPSANPMFKSVACTARDTLRKKSHRVIRSEDAIHVAQLNGKGVMGGSRSAEGGSRIGASKVGWTVKNGSLGGGVMEGGSLGGGGNVVEAT